MCQGDMEGHGPRSRGSAEIDRLGIRTLVMYNGPRGHNGRSTSFPVPIAQASAFDPALMERRRCGPKPTRWLWG